jgi:hypothetical protein
MKASWTACILAGFYRIKRIFLDLWMIEYGSNNRREYIRNSRKRGMDESNFPTCNAHTVVPRRTTAVTRHTLKNRRKSK